MAEGFKAGDVVQLKSGGPAMTVENYEPPQAHCVWFVDREFRRAVFKLDALVGAAPEEPAAARIHPPLSEWRDPKDWQT